MLSHEEFFRKSIDKGRLAHAYLFSGNDAQAKRETALFAIQYLNCGEAERPCLSCRACREIETISLPDLIWVAPEGKEIHIDQIRKLASRASLAPYQASHTCAVIEQAHLMNHAAQSAFLKLLEEPKSPMLFFLLCEYPAFLLDTVKSRTQEIPFFSFHSSVPESSELEKLRNASLAERFLFAKDAANSQNVSSVLESFLLEARSNLLFHVQEGRSSDEIRKESKLLELLEEMRLQVQQTNVSPRLALEQVLLNL